MQNTQRIGLGQARRLLLQLAPYLGDADRARIDNLLPWLNDCATDTELPLKQMVERLFASHSLEEGLKVFTNLRVRINKKAKEHNLSLGFNADTRKTTSIEERVCYFVGVCLDDQEAETLLQSQSGGSLLDYTEAEGRPEQDKPIIRFFISYAHEDEKAMRDLLQQMQHVFKNDTNFRFVAWDDGLLLAGQNWRGEIMAKMDESHFGLLLMSWPYLGSDFCMDEELKAYLPRQGVTAKTFFPVGLDEFPLDDHVDLKGLEGHQIFRLNNKKFYTQFKKGDPKRQKFAAELAMQIKRRIKYLFDHRLEQPQDIETTEPSYEMEAKGLLPFDAECFSPSKGRRGDIGNASQPQKTKTEEGELVQAYLQEWLADEQRAYFCLLGEYGMGKTVNCQEFAKTLIEQRHTDASIRLPFYFDLRNMRAGRQELDQLAANGDWFSIEVVIDRLITGGWQSTETPQLTGKRVLELLRADQAVVMFDGLDEVIVGMTAKEGSRFIQTLWNALPPNTAYTVTTEDGKPAYQYQGGKLLISCRSHYFRDMAEQNGLFLAQDRGGFKPDYYAAMTILPFDTDSVRQYLTLHFSEERAAQVEALINTVHNLEELSGRPYLLSLIREVADKLEEEKRAANIVNTASLYKQIVDRWLTRDEGKHQIDRLHKTELMEHLAAALWNSGQRSWPVQKLEKWLDRFLISHPEIKDALQDKARDIIKEDLRTATFIVRPDEDQFRFAHTSFQEYFLACYLYKALAPEFSEDLAPEKWALQHLASPETLDFVADLVEQAKDRQALTGIEQLLSQYQPKASEQALHYWLRARERNRPCPQPAKLDLPGLDFAELRLSGSPNNVLKLRNSHFANANLPQSRFEYIDFSGTDFSAAMLNQAEFNHCRLEQSQFEHARLAGAVLRQCHLTDGDLAPAKSAANPAINHQYLQQYLQRIQCTTGVEAPAIVQPGRLSENASLRMHTEFGHQNWVGGCAFSPDGQRVLSASGDNTLKLWSADSGECLLTLSGHKNSVSGCAFSPDGQRVLSASDDKTLKLWSADSGECLLTLSGHKNSVSGCAFSPDGQRVLSAGHDHTLKLWSADSGECLLTLSGHKNSVSGCAFSPDGQRVLSTGYDKTLKLWSVDSGDCLRTFSGHKSTVWSCAFSPDGQRVLSSADNTLKLWSADSGECLLAFSGHEDRVLGCAFSPDGQRVLSASGDKTLKLWSADSGECLVTFSGHQCQVNSCAFSPDGQHVLSAGHDHTLKLWSVDNGECLLTLGWNDYWVNSCVFSPDGHCVLSAGQDHILKLWSTDSGECLLTLSGHDSGVLGCAFSPDGQRVLSASDDNTLKLWSADSGECLLTLSGHQSWVSGCAFSPDGQRVLSASSDNTLKLWSADSGDCLATYTHLPENAWASIADNQLLAASDDAWRYLGWFGQGATTGERVKYPLEQWQPLQAQLAQAKRLAKPVGLAGVNE